MNATLGGLTFVGGEGAATYTIFRDRGLTGWFEGVEMRREIIARPLGNGDFPTPGRLGPRLITLSGFILTADDPAAFEVAMKALEDLLADGSMDTFTVEQATGTYTAEVGRIGTPEIIIEVYGSRARYRLQLWAPDPTKELLP
jgi:hypothetical protein